MLFSPSGLTEMAQEENFDFKELLAACHADLMAVRRKLLAATETQPAEKDRATKEAGEEFNILVGAFESKCGSVLR